ncbi:MAG: SMP-30/gluconolactonase/LRE family protein [Verrucomicrobiota bacterium]
MKTQTAAVLSLVFANLSANIHAQDTKNFPVIGKVLRFDDASYDLIAEDAEIEVLSSGFLWSEGPAWNKEGNYLLFSDVHNNRVHKWVEGQGSSIYLEPSGYDGVGTYSRGSGSNGLEFDHQGLLISCEHGNRRVSSMAPGHGKRTLVDNYQGKRFNSPNDLAIAANGDIYFTDPIYGIPREKREAYRELDFAGIFLIRAGTSEATLVTKEIAWPNGVELSPDEKTLYVAESDPQTPLISAYPLNKDGSLGDRKILFATHAQTQFRRQGPDGLHSDKQGNLWVGQLFGVSVISPQGKLLAHIETGERTANLVFGGPNGDILYITADTYLCRIQTKTQGRGH